MIVTVGGKPGAIGATLGSPSPISADMGGVTSAWAFYGVNTQPVGHEPGLNLIAGPYIAIAGVDNPAKSRVDITISGQAPPGQTPWLSQIDAAAHSLINLDFLQFKDGGSAAILSNAAPISISSGQAMFVGAKGNIYVSSGASLTQRLSVDTAGHVAISAADDGAIVLSAAGRIKSSSGGFVFPDNTTQITAAVAGVTGVTASAPLASSGGATPNITMTSPLPVANGGTGSTAPSLVAGANVVISGTWPNQTISSTGGSGGAQTPWLSDIDGASHNLLNAASVGATAGASLALKTSALSRLSIDTQGHVSISKPDAGAATSLLVADEIRVTTTGANANVVVYGPAGSNRNLLFGDTTNGVRWSFACDNSAESGGNIGSAFFIARWSDAGGYIDAPLYISRNDGTVTVKALYTSGQINANKVVLASGGSLQFGDGTIQTTAATGSGGSQTPWTQNINAASFQLQGAGAIGVGIAAPAARLVINGNAAAPTPLINGSGSGASAAGLQVTGADAAYPEIGIDSFGAAYGLLTFRASGGTNAAKTAVASGATLGSIRSSGYNGSGFVFGGIVSFLTTQAWTASAQGSATTFSAIKNNTTLIYEAMRIDQSGFVGIGTAVPGAALHINANVSQFAITGGGATKGAAFTVNNGAGDPTQGGLTLQRCTAAGVFEANLLTVNLANGFLGIATLAPAFPLDIQATGGAFRIASSPTSAQILQAVSTSGQPYLQLRYDSALTYAVHVGMGLAGGALSPDLVVSTFSVASGVWSERMRIANGGNVGIGVASPGVKLDLVSNDNTDSGGALRLYPQNLSQNATYSFGGITTTWTYKISTTGGNPIYLNPGGNAPVAVGTATLGGAATLEVGGNIRMSGTRSVLFVHGDSAAHVGGLQLITLGAGSAIIATPTDNTGAPISAPVQLGGFGAFNSNTVNLFVSGSLGVGTNLAANSFVFSKNAATPRAMSYSDGIQHCAADGSYAQLSLDSYGAQGGLVNFRCASGTNAAPGAVVASQILGQVNGMGWNGSGYAQSACIQFISQANWNPANTATSIVFDVTRQSTTGIFEVMRISAAGQGCVGIQQAAPTYTLEVGTDQALKAATSTWQVASDIRLKRNVRNLEGGLDVIRRLRPVEAEYNGLAGTTDGLRVVSFIADEVRDVVPHAVGSARRRLRKDDENETDVLDLNIHEILMHAILAIQQLAAAQPALRSS